MEHRCSPRIGCNLPVNATLRSGSNRPCVIRDISHDGMLLETGDACFPVGEVVNLGLPDDRVPGDERRVSALVVHARTGFAGLWLDEKDNPTHALMRQLCGQV